MTAFNTADIPDSITTLEQLSAWCSATLNYLYFDTVTTETTGTNTRVAQSAPFEIVATDPIEWRHISRVSLPLNKDWLSNGKIWEHITPLGSNNIPSNFKS